MSESFSRVIAAWPNASQRSRVCVGMNRSALGQRVKLFMRILRYKKADLFYRNCRSTCNCTIPVAVPGRERRRDHGAPTDTHRGQEGRLHDARHAARLRLHRAARHHHVNDRGSGHRPRGVMNVNF